VCTCNGRGGDWHHARDTVAPWRQAYDGALDAGFQIVCAFFFTEYVLRLWAAPGAPGWRITASGRSRLAWARSLGGVFDLFGALPACSTSSSIPLREPVRLHLGLQARPLLAGAGDLERVIGNARHALLSVLLGFGILLLLAASLAYLLERSTQPMSSAPSGGAPAGRRGLPRAAEVCRNRAERRARRAGHCRSPAPGSPAPASSGRA